MICIKAEIPKEICQIDDELKAIYHSKDTVCIWVFKSRLDRNKFVDETVGMKKKIEKIITLKILNNFFLLKIHVELMKSQV